MSQGLCHLTANGLLSSYPVEDGWRPHCWWSKGFSRLSKCSAHLARTLSVMRVDHRFLLCYHKTFSFSYFPVITSLDLISFIAEPGVLHLTQLRSAGWHCTCSAAPLYLLLMLDHPGRLYALCLSSRNCVILSHFSSNQPFVPHAGLRHSMVVLYAVLWSAAHSASTLWVSIAIGSRHSSRVAGKDCLMLSLSCWHLDVFGAFTLCSYLLGLASLSASIVLTTNPTPFSPLQWKVRPVALSQSFHLPFSLDLVSLRSVISVNMISGKFICNYYGASVGLLVSFL